MDWAANKEIRIKPKTMILSLLIVSLIETGMSILVSEGVQNSMMLLGGGRLLEITSLVFLVMVTEKGFSTIGLEKGKISQGIKKGIFWSGCFGIIAVFGFVLSQAMGIRLLEMVRIPMPSNPNAILLFFLVGGLIGPIAEELFFRGIVYGFLRRWGMLPAILLSTFIFVLAHPELPAIPVVQITGGLLFAIAYEVEGTLMAPLSIHIIGNTAIYTFSILFY
jgi:membrane protease YdiL (CAAX protease family)